jgi:hypothetical protein
LIDPALRVRRSVEWRGYYVIERRCRRAPAVNTGMGDGSDMHVQARDGYIHVATAHANWIRHYPNIMRELKHAGGDLWAAGGSERFANEVEYEEAWAKETRKRRRLGLYRAIAGEGFDILNRMNSGGERSRISNAGTTPKTHDEFLGRTA